MLGLKIISGYYIILAKHKPVNWVCFKLIVHSTELKWIFKTYKNYNEQISTHYSLISQIYSGFFNNIMDSSSYLVLKTNNNIRQ